MMEKPKKDDFKLKKFKLKPAQSAYVEYHFLFAKKGIGHDDSIKIDRTLPPHKDLIDLLRSLKGMVMQCEEIDYARRIMKINGLQTTKEVKQAIEGVIIDISNKIEITGITLAGKDAKRNCVITYKKMAGNKKIAGRSTTNINIEGNVYGFEQDLDETIKSIQSEVYEYLYGNKFDDVEQGQLYPDDNEKEGDKSKKTEKKK